MEAREFGERILWGCVRLKRPTKRQIQNIEARWARLQAEGLTEGIIDLTVLRPGEEVICA